MSGISGGVQALLQKKLGRDVPYIHCFNHELHLAIVHAIQQEPCAKSFFELSGSLHSFFHRHYVAQNYNVPSLRRLLEIRWTSHYDVTKCIVENKDSILDILSEVSEDEKATMDVCTEASGLLVQLKKHNVFTIGQFLLQVLGSLKPANALLQAQYVDMYSAREVIDASIQALKGLRDYSWLDDLDASVSSPPSKRKRIMSKQLAESIMLSTVGHKDFDNPNITPCKSLKRSLLNILDRAIAEMENRFSMKNLDIMKAVSCLLPKSSSFLDSCSLGPLQRLADNNKESDYMSLRNEIQVAKPMLLKKFPSSRGASISVVCKYLQEYKEAFPKLHKVYVTALVIGVSSASCESSFSTLTRALTPFRRTMLHDLGP